MNFDLPLNVADWVHRVGRTGRAGVRGAAHTFFVPQRDARHARELARLLRNAGQAVPSELERLAEGAKARKKGRTGPPGGA